MNQDTLPTTATELEAFCPVCPPVEEVTGQLEQLGYRLVFSLPAQPQHDHLPELPAQYHYRHASGAEAIFLAGRDSPLHTGVFSLPSHASRFWLSRAGRDEDVFRLTLSTLAVRLHLQWQEVCEDEEAADAREEVA